MIKIAPSLLSADFLQLQNQLVAIKEAQADWIHFDVMDGHFVPNLTFGPKILQEVKKASDLFLDVHIMVDQPQIVSDWFLDAHLITFHYEACATAEAVMTLIEHLHSHNIQAGLSVKPDTPITTIEPWLKQLDLVLVMSVEPGFGGQAFLPEALDKIRWLKQYRDTHHLSYLIEVDGGINRETGKEVIKAGADVLVAGSYIFKGDIKQNIAHLRDAEQ